MVTHPTDSNCVELDQSFGSIFKVREITIKIFDSCQNNLIMINFIFPNSIINTSEINPFALSPFKLLNSKINHRVHLDEFSLLPLQFVKKKFWKFFWCWLVSKNFSSEFYYLCFFIKIQRVKSWPIWKSKGKTKYFHKLHVQFFATST